MKQTLLIISVLLFMPTVTLWGQTKTIDLKVIETSDVHGHFFPYDFIERKPLQGTLTRVSKYVQQKRQEYGDRVLLLDNGDILQGQPCVYWSNYVAKDEPNLAAQVVNYMRYDAATMGNHDVETGHDVYDKWIQEMRCPVLGANIIDTKTGRPYLKPYTMIERDGVKIAVIGMITPTISCWLNESLWQGLEFQEMVSCAQKWVKHVQEAEHADIIIGLFHSGLEGGLTLPGGIVEDATQLVAQQVDGFDIIFFGHDHQVHNDMIKGPAGKYTLCLDPSNNARNVAEATISLTYEHGIMVKKEISGNIVDVRQEPIDQQMVSHFLPLTQRIQQFVERPIGRFLSTISTRDSYFGPSAFADLIHVLQLQITGADISLNAPLSFDAQIKEGPVTVSDMFKLYRYENQLCVVNMTGRELLGHLEMSYDLWVNTMRNADDHLLQLNADSRGDQQRLGFKNYTFNFDSAYGIDYEVDVTKPDGQKVSILKMSNGQPFMLDKTYRVAMNSYRANGGGDLVTRGAGISKEELPKRIVFQTPLDLRHYLMQEIERMGTVSPKAGHNWRFVPEEWTVPAAQRDRQLLFKE
ncbi:MAG: bifunctional metallophosphatase/5'-nucleotidase [Prevotella sp.]|nr:bifunctional metallophosphatase/5'-nucleotidase [Prevotella sp.]